MRELRHDFRREYSCSYDEVSINEAIDLIFTLPTGSLYMKAINPALAWPAWRHAIADVQDDLWAIAFARAGCSSDPPRVPRPGDMVRRKQAKDQARKAASVIETTEWVPAE